MRRVNGGAFIDTVPLSKYPGHPTDFPSADGESWYTYDFLRPDSEMRVGLFFEGGSEGLKALLVFGQNLSGVDLMEPAIVSDEAE